MDIHDIRRANYKQLLDEFRSTSDESRLPVHGALKRFAEHADVSARYLSHINNSRKRIGNKLARQLERGCAKSLGWLDIARGTDRDDDEFMHALYQRACTLSRIATRDVLLSIVAPRRT